MGLGKGLMELLFPSRCPFCGGVGAGVPCPRCREADFWVPLPERVTAGRFYTRCVCAGWYRDDLARSVRRFKFGNHPEYAAAYGKVLGESLAFFLPGAYEAITWMPVSPGRLAERGYDQSGLLAEALGEVTGKPVLALLEKTRDNPPQSSLPPGGDRFRNVAGVYAAPDPSQAAGRRLLLVDDILTTGATLEEGARTLLAAGAAQVVAAVLCRTPGKERP